MGTKKDQTSNINQPGVLFESA